MEVSVEQTSNLGRKVRVHVPKEEIQKAFLAEVQKVAKSARIDGFRPGKVPHRVIKQRFGTVILDDVCSEQIKNTLEGALREKELKPAAMPEVDVIAKGADLPFEYSATFDVLPKIELKSFAGVEIVKDKAEVKEIDVERTLKKLREKFSSWQVSDEKAHKDHQVTINFVGTVDGETFEGGTANDVALVLGSNSMIPGFEDQLIGVGTNEEVTIKVTFPEDYPAEKLAGKAAEFATTVTKVEQKKLPALDDAFAEQVGIKEGGMAKLRDEMRRTLERELTNAEYSVLKQRVMDKFLAMHEVELPESLVKQEVNAQQLRFVETLKQQFGQAMQNFNENQLKELANLQGADEKKMREQAERKVALGLLLSEYLEQHELKVDQDKLREKLEEVAGLYDDPEQAFTWLLESKERMAELEGIVMEEQIVDKLLEEAAVTELESSYDKVINLSGQQI